VADVEDKDRGWIALQRHLVDADGMNTRAGILSGVPKYPKSKGKVAVAKVAGVYGVHRMIGKVWSANRAAIDAAIDKAIAKVYQGVPPEVALVPVATLLRDLFRTEVKAKKLVDTGRLVEAIRGSLFDGSTFIAGDDPKQPRFTNKGPFR
jgi:hypothetical protein